MKIAVCFYGLVGSVDKKYGEGRSLNPGICYDYYKKNVIETKHRIDIFIHSQSVEFKDQLVNLYKPKLYKIEKQKNFFLKTVFHKKIITELLNLPIKMIYKKNSFQNLSSKFKNKFIRCLNLWSRWYSTKEVVDLKLEYENQNNFKYDLVMLTRFDLAFLTKFNFDEISKENLTVPNHNDVPGPRNNYQKKIEKNNRTFEKGISDFWFISSSQNIDIFSSLYNYFNQYNISSHVSSYEHSKRKKLNLNFYKFRGIDHEAIRRLNKSEK